MLLHTPMLLQHPQPSPTLPAPCLLDTRPLLCFSVFFLHHQFVHLVDVSRARTATCVDVLPSVRCAAILGHAQKNRSHPPQYQGSRNAALRCMQKSPCLRRRCARCATRIGAAECRC